MKVMIIVGARPNFMKAAPIISAIREYNRGIALSPRATETAALDGIQHILVHTGQHYDEAMSGSFFSDLCLPQPDVHLGVGSGSHAAQTAEIMRRFEEVLVGERPDVVVVVGDVNSTLACALVAAKISFDSKGTRPLIAHVEAGLRSFDRSMPEEVNRVLTDHVCDLLFVTEESGIHNLRDEGISDSKIRFVGNTMIDSVLAFKEKAEKSAILDRLGLRTPANGHGPTNDVGRYALLTLHRPSNVDDRDALLAILEGLEELANSCPVVFSAHPRTKKRIAEFGFQHFFHSQNGHPSNTPQAANGIRLLDPLGYLDFLHLMKRAAIVITDSGGIQEETTCLGVPCVTVRENTERPATVTCGTNIIAGTNPESIRQSIRLQLEGRKNGAVPEKRDSVPHTASSQKQCMPVRRIPEKWDGKSAMRIVETISSEFVRRSLSSTAVSFDAGKSTGTGIKSGTAIVTLPLPYQQLTDGT